MSELILPESEKAVEDFVVHDELVNYSFHCIKGTYMMTINACRFAVNEEGKRVWEQFNVDKGLRCFTETYHDATPEFAVEYQWDGQAVWGFNRLWTTQGLDVLNLSKALVISHKLADQYLLEGFRQANQPENNNE